MRQYIKEALGAADPHAVGKDMHPGNLYSTGNGSMPAAVRQAGGNVLDDEEADAQVDAQSKKRAACCLILSADGLVLAVSRKDDPTAFGLPGGKIDPGETAEEAAARELTEETGLVAKNLRQVFVRVDEEGWSTTTFACEAEGEINTPESGVIRWVAPEVLFNGPFGEYNKMLWEKLGLPVGVTPRPATRDISSGNLDWHDEK